MVDFLFVIIELFSLSLMVETLKQKFVEVGVFRRGGSYWCQKTKVFALSCAIKISAVHCLVLSQRTRVTDRRTHGQNYSQDRASIAASRGKNTPNEVGYVRKLV